MVTPSAIQTVSIYHSLCIITQYDILANWTLAMADDDCAAVADDC